MNFSVNSQLLAQELRILNKIVPTKPALPILMNVVLDARDRLSFYATDLELGLSSQCDATVTQPGSVTLPAKKLLDLIEQFPDGPIDFILKDRHVHINGGAFKSRLLFLPANDFPLGPTAEGVTLELSAEVFRGLIEKVRYAITDRTSKYMLKGALFRVTNGIAALVTTDAKRLSIATMPCVFDGEISIVIPSKTLDTLLAFEGSTVTFSYTDRHLFFYADPHLLISRTIDGTFPNYEQIIPRNQPYQIGIDRLALRAILKRVGLISGDTRECCWWFEKNSLNVSTISGMLGEAAESLPVAFEGEPFKLYTNWEHVLEFVDAAVGPTIMIGVRDRKSPILLSDGTDFLNVVMTMRG